MSTSPLGQNNKLQPGGGGDTFGMNDLAESLGEDVEQSGGSDLDFFGGGGGRPASNNSGAGGGGGGGLSSLGNLPPLGSRKPGKLDPIKFGNLPNLDDVEEKKKK